MPGMALRPDRVIRYVTAFCPACHAESPDRALHEVARLAGYLAVAEGRVWLVRGCPTHGRVVTLYDEEPEILAYLEQWTAPTKAHVPDHAGNWDPVPAAYLRGLGEMQTQHTCILLEDVTATCNLCCPTCFAESAPGLGGVVPVDEVLANVDQRLARENGRLDVLMLSGGEPTTHPRFAELLDRVLERDVVRVLVNSNGLALARDDGLLRVFERHRERVEVYLQFDGFRRETHRYHRGAELGRVKADAVRRLSEAGVFTTLTMTAALGVNDDEVGGVLRLALDTPFVGGVSVQPVFGSGRAGAVDPLARLTHGGVLARLGPQTGGLVTWRDLTALPCSHPHCCSVGYLLKTDRGEWRSLVGIIGHERLRAHLGLVANRINDPEVSAELRGLVKESLLGLLSEQSSLTHPSLAGLFRDVCEACDLGLSTLLRLAGDALVGNRARFRRLVGERIKRVTVKPFMDVHTMLEERLLQCCVHVGTRGADSDGGAHQCAPFCAAQAWAPLAAQKLSERARGRDAAALAVLAGASA
ncbi:radical SAM protein [Gemmatimonadetes bacterium T265]|nr:radical SAM protein [Gemmatimonadetes bacterium T265]